MPIALPEDSCLLDTSGYFSKSRSFGFALNFDNEYVAEAAIEPGILGIADTLTNFSVLLADSAGTWQDVTEQFFYGLPDECVSAANANEFGNQWYFSLPNSSRKSAEIQEFVQFFNHNFSGSGFVVEAWNYTFWAKPVWAKTLSELSLQIHLQTTSGKKWEQKITFHKKSSKTTRNQ